MDYLDYFWPWWVGTNLAGSTAEPTGWGLTTSWRRTRKNWQSWWAHRRLWISASSVPACSAHCVTQLPALMHSLYFLLNSDRDSALKTRTVTLTPTPGRNVWHTDCVLKDDLRENLHSANNKCTVVYNGILAKFSRSTYWIPSFPKKDNSGLRAKTQTPGDSDFTLLITSHQRYRFQKAGNTWVRVTSLPTGVRAGEANWWSWGSIMHIKHSGIQLSKVCYIIQCNCNTQANWLFCVTQKPHDATYLIICNQHAYNPA